MLFALAALALSSAAPTTPAPAASTPRVYVAPLSVADEKQKEAATLLGDRILVEAKKHETRFTIIGASDLKGALSVEAEQIALGCDVESCLAEVADALAAEQLVTGQLGHIGDTWQLTLTRSSREDLKVLGRATSSVQGDTPAKLLDTVPDLVNEVLGVRTYPLTVPGAVVAGAGVVAVGVAVALYAFSWNQFGVAETALAKKPSDVAAATAARDSGEAVLVPAYVVGGAGVLAVVVGAVLVVVDQVGGDE